MKLADNSKKLFYPLLPEFAQIQWDRFEKSDLVRRLVKGAFWSIVGALISRTMMLIASMIVARVIGKDAFGELGMINSTVGLFGMLAGFGLGITATKHIAEFRQLNPTRAGRIMMLVNIAAWGTGVLASAILYFMSPWLASHALSAPYLADKLKIGALLVLFGAINSTQMGMLAGFEAYERIALLGLVAGLANFICVVLGVFGWGLTGAIWGLVASLFISVAANQWILNRAARIASIPFTVSGCKNEMKLLWSFSLPAVMASTMVSPVIWFLQTLLVQRSDGYAGMAEYSVGAQWRNLVEYLAGLLCAAYLPVVSSLGEENPGRRRKLMFATAWGSGGLALSVSLIFAAACPYILRAYGDKFVAAQFTVIILLLTGVANSTNAVFMQSLLSAGRAWWRLVSNGCWAVIALASGVLVVPSYGAIGLAATLCLAQIIHLFIQIPLACKAIHNSHCEN